MITRFWISLAITLLAVAGGVYASFAPQTALPFDVKPVGNSLNFMIAPSSIGLPLPAQLRTGDIIDLSAMAPRDRMAFSTSVGNQPTQAVLNLRVRRNGQVVSVPVHFARIANRGQIFLVFLANVALNWLCTCPGLLRLGRGGWAFPRAARGTLMGALVLGQRPAEHYTQSARAASAHRPAGGRLAARTARPGGGSLCGRGGTRPAGGARGNPVEGTATAGSIRLAERISAFYKRRWL